MYKTIKKPLPHVDEALIIIKSDRRGTAYGVFDLSKKTGVSPWYWWAGVPTIKRKTLHIADIDFIYKAPSIKYRGIFLNDEYWGLKPWTSKLMDPQIFVPYKEVLDIYKSGMKLPEDVILVWPDDNFGYIKKLSNKEEYKSTFHQLVYYPVVGSALVNKKMLTAQKNRWYTQQGRIATNSLVEGVKAFDTRLTEITEHYNGLENGKWTGIMTAPERLPEIQLPPTEKIDLLENPEMGIFIPSGSSITNINVLPRFNKFTKLSHSLEVFNKGKKALKWQAKTNVSWILLNKKKGKIKTQETIEVTIDWSKAPIGNNITGEIEISAGKQSEKIYVSLHNPETTIEDIDVLYFENNGTVSVIPSKFSKKTKKKGIKVQVINQLGYEGNSVQLGSIEVKGWRNASAEYDFYSENSGYVAVYTYALPVFSKDEKNGTSYGVQIDNSMMNWETTASAEYSFNWKQNVIRNCIINTSEILIKKPRKHTLKLISGNPRMVLQKVVIDFGSMKKTHLWPKPTIVSPKQN